MLLKDDLMSRRTNWNPEFKLRLQGISNWLEWEINSIYVFDQPLVILQEKWTIFDLSQSFNNRNERGRFCRTSKRPSGGLTSSIDDHLTHLLDHFSIQTNNFFPRRRGLNKHLLKLMELAGCCEFASFLFLRT